jgi:hypothetical protein
MISLLSSRGAKKKQRTLTGNWFVPSSGNYNYQTLLQRKLLGTSVLNRIEVFVFEHFYSI